MEKVGILFLGGAKRVSMAEKFISAGQSLGVEVAIYSYELSREVPVSAVAGILTGLKWGDPGIYEDLHAKVTSHSISLMVPLSTEQSRWPPDTATSTAV